MELGSGAADKARVLLDAMDEAGALRRYVPFDVSESVFQGAAEQLVKDYDGLRIGISVCGTVRTSGNPGAIEAVLVHIWA